VSGTQFGTGSGNQTWVTPEASNYTFFAIKRGANASYFESITITYETSLPTQAITPTFNPVAGDYTASQDITLSSTTEDAAIYYTTDGSEPTNESTLYSSPFAVYAPAGSVTVKAIAYKDGLDPSAVAEATYNFPASLAISAPVALSENTTLNG